MPRIIPNEVKELAIRLRREERLSIDDIQRLTGLSVGTLSVLLRPYPLTQDEVRERKSESAIRNNPSRRYTAEVSKFATMVADEELATSQKGRVAELAVAFRLSLLGYWCWKPDFEGCKVDWLVSRPNDTRYLRLQVKWARRGTTGRPLVALTNGEGKRLRHISAEYCDFVTGYDLETDTAFVMPVSVCVGNRYKTCDEQYAEAWHLLGI